MYELVIIDEAKKELRHEIAYSKKKWGQVHGQKYAKELQERIRDLKENPHLYPVRNDVLPNIRVRTYKGNRIVYTIQEKLKRIVVLAILSLYQNIEIKKLKKRKLS